MSDESRIVKDPICGKDVDTLRARAVGIFGGVTYYFCSADCKSKYVDPRTGTRESTVDSRAPGAVADKRAPAADKKSAGAEKKKRPEPEAELEAGPDAPVRYARSRLRRVTGEVSTPVVQIDLSPNKKPAPPADTSADEPLEPARSGRGWALLALFMLIIAGGVIFYVLKHR